MEKNDILALEKRKENGEIQLEKINKATNDMITSIDETLVKLSKIDNSFDFFKYKKISRKISDINEEINNDLKKEISRIDDEINELKKEKNK